MADKSATLRWSGEALSFEAHGYGGPPITLDSASVEGPSPMDALLVSVAGCMAIDVLMILRKSRVRVDALEVEVEGDRADAEPRRFVAIRLVYRVKGPGEEDEGRLQRAIELSREKYCSVLHSLHPQIDLDIRVERA
ncbi:MAG: OsmC family protein [Longimicrobiales bacterium]|nr:OsmC family protein [Longimicrobiales bacterium]